MANFKDAQEQADYEMYVEGCAEIDAEPLDVDSWREFNAICAE